MTIGIALLTRLSIADLTLAVTGIEIIRKAAALNIHFADRQLCVAGVVDADEKLGGQHRLTA